MLSTWISWFHTYYDLIFHITRRTPHDSLETNMIEKNSFRVDVLFPKLKLDTNEKSSPFYRWGGYSIQCAYVDIMGEKPCTSRYNVLKPWAKNKLVAKTMVSNLRHMTQGHGTQRTRKYEYSTQDTTTLETGHGGHVLYIY